MAKVKQAGNICAVSLLKLGSYAPVRKQQAYCKSLAVFAKIRHFLYDEQKSEKKLCLVRAESLQIRAMWERKKMARAFIFRQNNNIGFRKKKKILLNFYDRTKTIYLHISNNHSKTQPLIFLPSANPLYYSLLSTDCFFSFDLFNLMV